MDMEQQELQIATDGMQNATVTLVDGLVFSY